MSLTDKEKKALMARHRELFKLAGYNRKRVHKKQMEFHRCSARNRWVFGGNRTGKTECGAVEAVWFARGIHPYREIKGPTQGWVVSLTGEVQRDVAQKKVLSYLPKEWIHSIVMKKGRRDNPEGGIIDFILVRSVHGGLSMIGFKSCDQGRSVFQGTSLDWVWFDEEPPLEIYEECRMRVLDRKGDIWGTMTPLMGLTWVHEQIYLNTDDPEVWHQTMSWQDNPYLDKGELELMERVLSKEQRRSRQYGEFASKNGLVYPEFDERVHVIEPFDIPEHWQSCISIDPGFVNPLSAHWYAVDGDGNIYVVAEHFQSGKDCVWHSERIKQISRQLSWKRDSAGRYAALIDSAALQRTLSGTRSVAQLFSEQGIAVNPKVDKNVPSGIQLVKQYLTNDPDRPRLYIFNCCSELIREFKTYRYGSGEEPIKKDDHALDELRYFVASRPSGAVLPKAAKNEVQKDLERLIYQRKRKRF
ncbi:MAG: terminase family protein [Clostridia bacterium]|nr:terminase family protein [Clostridia bacterium]